MSMIRNLLLCALVVLTALPAFAESGVRGRVAWRGELISGIVVRAYQQIADIALGKHVAVSEATDLDGIYQLALSPGSYVLTASNSAGKPEAGDYFCYYSGSPVQVPDNGYRNVGFNLVRIPEEQPVTKAKRSAIYGQLTYQGEPLEKAYLYVYQDPSRHFKGPGYFIQPVERGDFRLNLPPGDYYLLARKRTRGGQFGPIEIGDYFNYYHGNPVHIGEGEVHEVKIEAVTRLSMLEEDVVAIQGVRGQVLDGKGQPQPGLYVFAYRRQEMTGTPDYFSQPTGADGSFELSLPQGEPYYLLAREAFGGPAAHDEFYGKLLGSDGAPQAVKVAEKNEEVVIHVAPKGGN